MLEFTVPVSLCHAGSRVSLPSPRTVIPIVASRPSLCCAVVLLVLAPSVCVSPRVQLTFEQAAERVKTLKDKPSNDVLLQIYGLYKQATVGDNTGAQPWAVQMEARAKWDAWTSQKGTLPAFPRGH